ncbi:MAG: sigma 54-interacting transcriptional regulator [Syntrophomonadaceae bacterium]|nr:sigma 54-interacting transcriptional regulator [Syntrophomonadaceae bacterium]
MNDLIEIIGIKEENCTNCHQCIAVCPIKICSDGSGDVVKFDNNLCIGCGRCIEACVKSHSGVVEKSARFAIDDTPQFLADLPEKEMVALIAPSAHSNFNLKKLITALKELGIKYVYDVSLGAEITVALYHDAIEKGEVKLPLIATPCPAIVKYIQLNHSTLLNHLAPFGSPVHNLSVYVKSLHPEAEQVFFSPCLEKRREIQDKKIIKYNVIYQSLQKILKDKNIDIAAMQEGEFDQSIPAGIATNFSTPGGLKESYLFHYPETKASSIARVEGSIVFDNYLRRLERSIHKKSASLPLIVDILSCEKGCNMGVGCINKAVGEIEYAIATRSEQSSGDEAANHKLGLFLKEVIKKHDFSAGPYSDLSHMNQLEIPDDKQLKQIYIDMHKLEEKDFRNCAACGYNSCHHMAIAIFNGLNKVQNCHLYQEKELLKEQQALRNMHMELSDVFGSMSDGVIVLNKEGRVSQFNPAAQKIIGYSDEALIGVHVVDLFSGKAPGTLNLLQTGQPFDDREILLDGFRGKIHAMASGKPRFDENNKIAGATVILRPIAHVQDLVNTFSGAQATFTFDSIIGEDKQLKRCIELARRAGINDSTVLLQAASGTGKEVFAQAIHNGSLRRNGPFVAINCAALPRELVGSELFGYVEGAFTGAKRGGRPGKFELANKGTLFLDEIGDMPLEQQAMLLRAIQEKAILRVGGDSLINVDVRIIAATNQNLLNLVHQGRFRADLYYRLNVVQIIIPALKERRDDIKILFEHFIQQMSPKFNRQISKVDPAVIKCLEVYDWPGNIRELQNVVERILLVAEDGRITVDYLPREIVNEAVGHSRERWDFIPGSVSDVSGLNVDRSMRKLYVMEQEKEKIIRALDMHGGVVSRAAAELGISRNTFYRKMKNYGITN